VVLVLDTCEELAKLHPGAAEVPAVERTFDLLVAVQAAAPGTRVNPVISREDQHRLRQAAADCAAEARAAGGEVLVDRSGQAAGPLPALTGGHLVGPSAFLLPAGAAVASDSMATSELFGPIVHVIPIASLQEAVTVANAPDYALTCGIYSQSQDDIDWLADRLFCGNLYINRPITGARVAVEPFGGFRMSGTGPKAGGSEYLAAFYDTTVATPDALDAQTVALLAELAGRALVSPGPAPASAGSPAPAWQADAAALERGRLLAVPLQRSLVDLPHHLLQRDAAREASAVAAVAVSELASWRDGADRNRQVPGQDSFNRWSLPRGPAVVLAGSRSISGHAAAHAVAALCAGNPVQILACSAQAEAAWKDLAAYLDVDALAVVRVHSAIDLTDALMQPVIATVIFDGSGAAWAAILPLASAIPAGQQHLRRLLAAGTGPFAARERLRSHLHCRSFAVHTMRHGAPLTL